MCVLVALSAGAYLPSPLYPGYQDAFGFNDLTMTLIYAMFALVSAPALLLFGPASDVLGRRTVLRFSVAAAAVASACFALAQGPAWLVAGRAVQGLALGAATGAATTLITECNPGRNRLRASVLASMVFVAGTAVGPVTSGLLAQYAPAPRVLPFVVHLALLAGVWRRVSALPAPVNRLRRWSPTRAHIPVSLRPLFVGAAGAGFLAWTTAGVFLAVIPAVLSREAGFDNVAASGAILGAVLACSMLSQSVVARRGARFAQLAGLATLMVSLGALALTGGGSVVVTMLAAVAAGTGHGLAYGGSTAAIETAMDNDQRAGVSSALYVAFYLGAGGPAVAVGLLTSWLPLTTAISWISAVSAALVPLVIVAVVGANRSRREDDDTKRGRWVTGRPVHPPPWVVRSFYRRLT